MHEMTTNDNVGEIPSKPWGILCKPALPRIVHVFDSTPRGSLEIATMTKEQSATNAFLTKQSQAN